MEAVTQHRKTSVARMLTLWTTQKTYLGVPPEALQGSKRNTSATAAEPRCMLEPTLLQ